MSILGELLWFFQPIDNDKVSCSIFRGIDPLLFYVIHVFENLIFKI